MKLNRCILLLTVASCIASSPAAAGGSLPATPNIPTNVFKVTDHGAAGDGTTLDTAAIQKTIDAASSAGGGVVLVPKGRFLTGPLKLASRINLRVDRDATLVISDDMEKYPLQKNRYVDSISVNDAEDVELSGEGTIDGQGKVWWTAFEANKSMPRRPNLIRIADCTRVRVRDLKLINSPCFHRVPQNCTDVTIQGVTIQAPDEAHNTDAIDPSGWNFYITHCTIANGDDNIAIKPTKARSPGNKNYLITNCRFLHGHGMSIGSGTDGGIEDIVVRDCSFDTTEAGIRIKTVRGRGGVLQNLLYENITMNAVKVPVYISDRYPERDTPKDPAAEKAEPVSETTPINRNIVIRNLVATNCPTAGILRGLPEAPISNLTFSNVTISAKAGMKIIHAEGIRFIHSKVTSQKEPRLTQYNAKIEGWE